MLVVGMPLVRLRCIHNILIHIPYMIHEHVVVKEKGWGSRIS